MQMYTAYNANELKCTYSVALTKASLTIELMSGIGVFKHVCSKYCDLGPMTLKLNYDLDILKLYHHTKNEVAR